MGSNKVGFGAGTIKTTGQLCIDTRTEFDRLAGELTTEISQLSGKYGGTGAVAFASLNTTWSEKQSRIVKTLERFQSTLDESERSITVSDEESAGSVNAIAGRMGDVKEY